MSAPLRELGGDTRGAVLLEYLIFAAFAGVVVAIALATVGPATVANYSKQRASLYQSNP
jgi:Flp pilus assembly pilin Flp